MHLPLEIQLLILESAPWESHPTLSLVCRKWRSFIMTSLSVLRSRYRCYSIPINHAGGPRASFDGPLYHGILSYLTHYVRMDDGLYHACHLKQPSRLGPKGELTKGMYLLNQEFFANDFLSAEPSSFTVGRKGKKGKEAQTIDECLSRLKFVNRYAHERRAPLKQRWPRSSEPPTVGEFLTKNGQAVNNRAEPYYGKYSHADVLKVVMKYTKTEVGECFLEFALVPLPKSSGNVNSTRQRQNKYLVNEPGQTRNLVRKWEIMGSLKAMIMARGRKPRDGNTEFEHVNPLVPSSYEGKLLPPLFFVS